MDEIQEYNSLVRRAFEQLASYYDLIALPLLKVRTRVARLVTAGDGARVLDVATGTGAQALAFAKRGYEVLGVDLSEAMLTVARKKNKFRNLRFEAVDATGLPFPNASFDVSSISFALHDMPLAIEQKVLREMVRVTRPGGDILVVDYGLPRNRIGRFLIYSVVKSYEGEFYLAFIQRDLTTLLRQAGIEVSQEIPVLFGAARILIGTRPA